MRVYLWTSLIVNFMLFFGKPFGFRSKQNVFSIQLNSGQKYLILQVLIKRGD